MRRLSLEDIKREAFDRAGASPSSEKVASSDISAQELASGLKMSGYVDPERDDGLLMSYARMYKEAQRRAADRLGLVNGRLSLR